ncbi:MAG TPA: hypothetical protein VIO80_08435 [Candidatus Dormibacteraeota bacterium]
MLGSALEKRLRAALDEVTPPSPLLASARYRQGAAKRLSRAWRFAPALVATAAAGAALTATAATGSPNPAIWKDRAGTVIQNVGHFPSSSPKAVQSPKPQLKASTPTQTSRPAPSSHEIEPKPTAEPTERPEPSPSPQPTEVPEPSPTPDTSGGSDPSPSPSGSGE